MTASSLETVWEHREEVLYPSLFGQVSRGIFLLPADLFTDDFGQRDIDPRWLHHGVLEFGPTSTRSTWLYVTSGTSNPWDLVPADFDQTGYSGLGTELVLETPAQSDWAIHCLRKLLAYNLLLAHGRFGELDPLHLGARIPLGGPIDGNASSQLRFVIMAEPANVPSSFQLASGQVDLLQVIGITEAERDLAKIEGIDALLVRLTDRGAFPAVDPARASTA